MITKVPHEYYIREKMKEDPVTCDIIALHNSHLNTPKEERTGEEAYSPVKIKIRKGVD